MRPRVRPPIVAAAAVLALLVVACGEEQLPAVAGDVTINAPADAGSGRTIPLNATERGEGRVGVVLAHQLGSNQSSWILLVDPLVEKGFRVLTFDFRGHGLSGGERNPSLAALDLAAAVDRMRSLGAEKIFVVGASMGGTAAIVVASQQKLEGVVTLSAPTSIDTLSASDAVRTLDEPALFIAAEKDGAYTDAARTFASQAPAPRRLEIIAGSGAHGTDLLNDEATRQRVTDLIIDFLVVNRS